jgi:hypothetical protein
LHISRKHPAWGSQIERLCCKMDLNAGFHELANLSPILLGSWPNGQSCG